jgi:DNA-binding MarR family transcriptional regulator
MEPGTAPTRLVGTPSWLLNQAAQRATRTVGAALTSAGAHRTHFSVLAALDEYGPASQASLGRRCGIDRSDMVALVDTLAAGGYLERRQDPDDRRRNLVSITAAGRGRLRELATAVSDAQDDALAPLTAAERTRLVALLQALVVGRGD